MGLLHIIERVMCGDRSGSVVLEEFLHACKITLTHIDIADFKEIILAAT